MNMNVIQKPLAPVSLLIGETEPQNQDTNPMMGTSFETVLAKALEPVNALQLESAALDTKLASGQLEYVHQAMVVGEKASMALDLTIQIRNKALEAYQEIMRTQV